MARRASCYSAILRPFLAVPQVRNWSLFPQHFPFLCGAFTKNKISKGFLILYPSNRPFPLGGQPVYGGGGGGREEVALPSSSWLRGTQFTGIGFVGMRVKPCNFSLALFANQQLLGFSPFYFVYWLLAQ